MGTMEDFEKILASSVNWNDKEASLLKFLFNFCT